MIINRPLYLQKLIDRQHNHMVKILTGIRRCGKTFLLFDLYTRYLMENGIKTDHIIKIDMEDRRNHMLCDPDRLIGHIDSLMTDDGMYYIMIDEVQRVTDFVDVLNSYLKTPNADVYVTGSNARFLSKDVATEFRGRGDEVKVYPLSFKEYYSAIGGDRELALNRYMTFGGMPQTVGMANDIQLSEYLKNLFLNTYIRDIKERYDVRNDEALEILIDIIASDIGSLTNPTRLANTFESTRKMRISPATLKTYLDYLCDSFLVSRCARFDVKGRKYIDSPNKYYFTDLGLRNARINFRQTEPTHILENAIYNELIIRGFNVDVGVVPTVSGAPDGRRERRQYEIDFVCNQGSRRYYIQSAYRMMSPEKERQEEAALLKANDSFKKIIITADNIIPRRNEKGILTISIYDFLLDTGSLEI